MELLLILFVGILLIIWLIYAYLYFSSLLRLSHTESGLRALYQERINELPLFMMILKPHIVKSDEVFSQTIRLHHELLFYEDDRKEKTLRQQIQFLLTVAEQHKELLTDSDYKKETGIILSLNNKIDKQVQIRIQQRSHWQDIHHKSLLCLFPGYFLFTPRCVKSL